MRTTLPCGLLLALLALAPLTSAQSAPALDPKTQAQYENLLNHKFSRDLSEVFTALVRIQNGNYIRAVRERAKNVLDEFVKY